MTTSRVHFWAPEASPPGVEQWDPDTEPWRFADGFGHNVLELYVRMQQVGYEVSLGRRVPAGSRVVVFLPSLLERRSQLMLVGALLPHRRVQLVSIRSDFLTAYRLPFRPSLEVMPNRSSVTGPHQCWIPPLPQRGLIARTPDRGDAMTTLTYKGYPENLPAEARSAGWLRQVRQLGFEWDPDVRDDAGHNRWHDFSVADVALCLRGDASTVGLLRKPATKLLNAWCAGVIPLVGREPAYLELVKHREDAMVVDSAEDVLATLAELRVDQGLVRRLRQGVAARAVEFDRRAVLESWMRALTGPLPFIPLLTVASAATVGRVATRFLVHATQGDTRSPVWRPKP